MWVFKAASIWKYFRQAIFLLKTALFRTTRINFKILGWNFIVSVSVNVNISHKLWEKVDIYSKKPSFKISFITEEKKTFPTHVWKFQKNLKIFHCEKHHGFSPLMKIFILTKTTGVVCVFPDVKEWTFRKGEKLFESSLLFVRSDIVSEKFRNFNLINGL